MWLFRRKESMWKPRQQVFTASKTSLPGDLQRSYLIQEQPSALEKSSFEGDTHLSAVWQKPGRGLLPLPSRPFHHSYTKNFKKPWRTLIHLSFQVSFSMAGSFPPHIASAQKTATKATWSYTAAPTSSLPLLKKESPPTFPSPAASTT